MMGVRLFIYSSAICCILLGFGTGCDTHRDWRPLNQAPTVTVPDGMRHAALANWQVAWEGGQAPFAVAWNFGGGAVPDTAALSNAVSPAASEVEMRNTDLAQATGYTYSVTVTDAGGQTATATGQYSVGVVDPLPTVTATYQNNVINVTLSWPYDGDVTVTATGPPAGLQVSAAVRQQEPFFTQTVQVVDGAATVQIPLSNGDILAGATADVAITATDTRGLSVDASLTATIQPIGPLAADTLYAIPLDATVTIDDEVTVVVAMSTPAYPFQYMNGVGVTVESAAEYVRNSFDVGVPDETPDSGGANPVDGLWAEMNPSGGFLLAPDNFITGTDIGGGLTRWDFNITPIGGSDQAAANGALFNFRLSFTAAGTYHLGFQEYEGVARTYYTGDDSVTRYWGDISNDYTGVPNSITVTE